jgi:hypothetical protein
MHQLGLYIVAIKHLRFSFFHTPNNVAYPNHVKKPLKVWGKLHKHKLNLWIHLLRYHLKFSFNFTVATPLWPSVGVKPNTSKVGDLESSGTPECLEFDSKAQNTSHWGVLGVIGKVLKLRYRKWPRIGHLDICSPSYGQKKGRESNCQFDSRPLKVGINLFPTSELKVRYVIGKILMRATSLV